MSLMKKAIGGSIHRIREFELEKVNLADEFDILQIVGEGWFGKILLTEHRSTQTEMVLKALPKAYTGVTDFYREFHYGLHLSAHRNIITTYDVAFETAGFYIFSQEYAPLGDLTSNVTETGLGELHAKRVARQLAAAVHHIHSRELVHRDIKLDNILVFRSDFSRIKLCDFGETRRANTVVRRHNEWLPYSPPEVLQIDTDDTYKAHTSHDVWQFGIVLFVCLTGCIPWQKAAMDDRRYTRYLNWHTATLNIAKKPKLFQLISSKAQRMFKRLLEPKLEKRPVSVLEVNKYLEDRWLAKLGAEKAMNGGADERDELSPSMYSFHSSLEEKNQLLYTLTQYGIETTVDRTRKKDRIREWIESSAIAEENESEGEGEAEPSNGNSEGDEDGSMKGRHFPERRPSVRETRKSSTPSSVPESSSPGNSSGREHETRQNGTSSSGKARRAHTILSANNRIAAGRAARHVQRRNPFAPQVAQERHTLARYGSFPNGDPSQAIGQEREALLTENAAKLAELEKEQELLRSVSNVINDSIILESRIKQSANLEQRRDDSGLIAVERRENGTPNNSDAESFEERQKMAPPANPQAPIRRHRHQNAPFPSPLVEPPNKDYFAPFLINNPPLSGNTTFSTSGHATLAAERIDNPADLIQNNSNPLTMTVASHLVMQSFNALQTFNPPPASTTDKSEISLPRDVALPHGKDAYEHYGVSHQRIPRNELPRQGSTGSGSRSVSN